MTPAQERKLDNVERLLKILITDRKPEWISEEEVMVMLQRSKYWLKIRRNGKGEIPASLVINKDWRYLNGRTPEYRYKSIEELKRVMNLQVSKSPRHRKLQIA